VGEMASGADVRDKFIKKLGSIREGSPEREAMRFREGDEVNLEGGIKRGPQK